MIVSANYWKEMSKTPHSPSEAIKNPASAFTDDGGLTASDVLEGVEWRWKRLETGNIKVKVAASGAEASGQAATRPTVSNLVQKGGKTQIVSSHHAVFWRHRFVASGALPYALVRLKNISFGGDEGSRRPARERADMIHQSSHVQSITRLFRAQYVSSPIRLRCHRTYLSSCPPDRASLWKGSR